MDNGKPYNIRNFSDGLLANIWNPDWHGHALVERRRFGDLLLLYHHRTSLWVRIG